MKKGIQILSFFILLAVTSALIYKGFILTPPGADIPKKTAELLGFNENLSFSNFVQNVHAKFLKNAGNAVYLDNAKRALYTTEQIKKLSNRLQTTLYGNPHSESKSSELASDTIEDLRFEILEYFNADISQYTLVYTHSNTQSLKLIGEAFPFSDKSTFYYSTTSSEDILGVRSFVKNGQTASFSPNDLKFNKIKKGSNNLIAVPLVDELTGECLSEEQMKKLKQASKLGNYTAVMVDASLYLATHKLDLSKLTFDCITFGLDTVIGHPSIGFAIIKNDLIRMLNKPYFGGGTLVYALTTQPYEKLRLKPAQRLEDGSLPFLTLASTADAFEFYEAVCPNMVEYTAQMGSFLYQKLSELNGTVKIYGQPSSSIVSFNIFENGQLVDWHNVVSEAREAGFIISGGCQRTPGTCEQVLGFTESSKQTKANDFGVLRASVGWLSTENDVQEFADWIQERYQEHPSEEASEEVIEEEPAEQPKPEL